MNHSKDITRRASAIGPMVTEFYKVADKAYSIIKEHVPKEQRDSGWMLVLANLKNSKDDLVGTSYRKDSQEAKEQFLDLALTINESTQAVILHLNNYQDLIKQKPGLTFLVSRLDETAVKMNEILDLDKPFNLNSQSNNNFGFARN